MPKRRQVAMRSAAAKTIYKALDIAGRDLPHDQAAEEELVGIGFASAEILDVVADMVTPREFYFGAFGTIWNAMLTLRVENKPVNIVTVVGKLRERDELLAVGDLSFVGALSNRCREPDVELAVTYARTLRELSHRRKITEALQVQLGEAYSGRTSHTAFVEGVESAIFHATKGLEAASEGVDLGVLMDEEERRLEEISLGHVSSGGLPTGLAPLDAQLGGLAEGETIIVAGRPGMGKSALLFNIAINVAASNHDGVQQGVLVFSLEMSRRKFAHRAVAAEANVNLNAVKAGKLKGVEADAAARARGWLRTLPLVVDEATGCTPSRVRSRLRRAMMRFNREASGTEPARRISLVAIDSLQWMRAEREYGTSTGDRSREVGDTLKALVEIGKETGVSFAIAAQLNRDVGKRTGKDLRPRLTDLAESGDVEKHAHGVVFAHRPEYYVSDKSTLTEESRRAVELIIAKQRDGATGLVKADYIHECTRFQAHGGTHAPRC
jgi:replicative DNA helicase